MALKFEDTDILNCRLCSSFLNIPKRLPCLHMFCESCLQTLLLSTSKEIETAGSGNFMCPTCKSECPCPKKSSDISKVVSEFPTYNFIETVIRRAKITPDTAVCAPCQREENEQKAKRWCVECDEGLCEDCHRYHGKMKTFISHRVVAVSEISKHQQPIRIERHCVKHSDQDWDHFCVDHNEACCSKCVTTVHRKCNEVTSLEEASVHNRQYCSEELKQRLKETLDAEMETLLTEEDKLKEIQYDQDGTRNQVAALCTDMKKYIDELESKFNRNIKETYGKATNEIQTRIEKIQNMQEITSNCDRLLETFLESASDVDLFLDKELIEDKVAEQEGRMSDISDPNRVKYEVSLTPELVCLKSSIQSLGTLKCVKVSPVQQTVPEFQDVPNNVVIPMRDCKPHGISTFSVNTFNNAQPHGVVLLSDGRLLLTNYDKKSLSLFNAVGKLQKQVKLPGSPWGVTVLNGDKAAISYSGYIRSVGIVDINSMSILQRNIFKVHHNIVGITSYGDRLFVVCENRIIVLDMLETLIKEIKTPPLDSSGRYITAISDGRLCYSNRDEGSVVCIDMDDTVMWTYKHDDLLKGRCNIRITSDNEGIVYVTGFKSNNVRQISPDGRLLRIMLCQNDGITKPYAIHFDRKNYKLVLTHSESIITIYQMK